MFSALKRKLYFPIAYYFRFFSYLKLLRWNPRIIVVTGSNGKTTTMSLIESELGDKAYYSHHANSAYGIPFNILGLSRKSLMPLEWIGLFLLAPVSVLSSIPKQKIYVVEADCDRPGEGNFLSALLRPEVLIWLSSEKTHSMNFDVLVDSGKFKNVESAIAHEYGFFLERTTGISIINGDSNLIINQASRTQAETKSVRLRDKLQKYTISKEGTAFRIGSDDYRFKCLLPKVSAYSIISVELLFEYLDIQKKLEFKEFILPPGRSSVFAGKKNTTIIDSSYNANLSSMKEVIQMFNSLSGASKWAVIGDMIEQGKVEKEEHEKLAELLVSSKFDRVVLLGPRIKQYGLAILEKHYKDNLNAFESPKDVLKFLTANISGGEVILFKGARFMEGIIEHLLENPKDSERLSRREKAWELRRRKWGL